MISSSIFPAPLSRLESPAALPSATGGFPASGLREQVPHGIHPTVKDNWQREASGGQANIHPEQPVDSREQVPPHDHSVPVGIHPHHVRHGEHERRRGRESGAVHRGRPATSAVHAATPKPAGRASPFCESVNPHSSRSRPNTSSPTPSTSTRESILRQQEIACASAFHPCVVNPPLLRCKLTGGAA